MISLRKQHHVPAQHGWSPRFGTHFSPQHALVAQGLSCYCHGADTIHKLTLYKFSAVRLGRVIRAGFRCVKGRASVNPDYLTLRQVSRPANTGETTTNRRFGFPSSEHRPTRAPRLHPDARSASSLPSACPGALSVLCVCCVGVEACPYPLPRLWANQNRERGVGQSQLRNNCSLSPALGFAPSRCGRTSRRWRLPSASDVRSAPPISGSLGIAARAHVRCSSSRTRSIEFSSGERTDEALARLLGIDGYQAADRKSGMGSERSSLTRSNTPEASGTARKAPSGKAVGAPAPITDPSRSIARTSFLPLAPLPTHREVIFGLKLPS
jgi:hypothetical protein